MAIRQFPLQPSHQSYMYQLSVLAPVIERVHHGLYLVTQLKIWTCTALHCIALHCTTMHNTALAV